MEKNRLYYSGEMNIESSRYDSLRSDENLAKIGANNEIDGNVGLMG